MQQLTSQERIMRIFQNKEVDRPALKLWGASLDNHLLHPDYQPVCELAAQVSDLFVTSGSPFDVYYGQNAKEQVTYEIRDTKEAAWKDKHITFHTPKGSLHGIERISTLGEPSYTIEYMIKEPQDLEKLLAIEYQAIPYDIRSFELEKARLGDRGVVMHGADHAGYALQRLMGSENLAYFSADCRDQVEAVIGTFSARIREYVQSALAAGITSPFAWVGPELLIPPLLAPRDFEDFVFRWDKLLCDDIHQAGGYVWVHCHGKVANLIERFIEMGVDVLNPLEPPKNGDIELEAIIRKFGNRLGWEGNIEIQEILQADPERLKELILSCVTAGNASGRFILCPSAGFMEYPFPSPKYIDNLLLYLKYGRECVEKCSQ